ncbi:hypothetical protein FGLOB1_11332 [Fusarium globosum]|uniref:Uncharacterized protein n=1 Tax=Fusarium globosum TaxID=78864 RepID=A0A8H5XT77_9HYPO|nr:hypothetical protein FGLOB1_11332 [Fusarium globosum]
MASVILIESFWLIGYVLDIVNQFFSKHMNPHENGLHTISALNNIKPPSPFNTPVSNRLHEYIDRSTWLQPESEACSDFVRPVHPQRKTVRRVSPRDKDQTPRTETLPDTITKQPRRRRCAAGASAINVDVARFCNDRAGCAYERPL